MGDSRAEHVLGQLHHWLRSRSLPSDDGQLLERFVHQRDEQAFAELVARHGPLVFGLCRRLLGNVQDAEDVFQATFLVLARKAGTIRKPQSLSCWLHGVAYRLALKARAETQSRRSHEQQAQPSGATVDVDLSWREVRGLLDEELQRLPEKQRVPLVLCYLEGLTQDEASRRLGWPRGTLKRRLEAGRERLRLCLTRRGVTLGAGLFAAALSDSAAKGSVSVALRRATVQAAMQFVTNEAAALATTSAALLAKGALQTMLTTKLKLGAIVILLLGCAVTAAGLALPQAPPEKQPDNKANAPAPAPAKVAPVVQVATSDNKANAPAPAPAKVAPVVQVATYYTGMPASSIEKNITNRIERWCNQAPGVRRIASHSLAGVSLVRVYFRDDIDPNGALTMTGQLALGTLPTLPPNTLPPVTLPWSPRDPRPVGVLALYSATARETKLHRAARFEIREGLLRIKEAVAPVVLGGKERSVVVHLDAKKLQTHDLKAKEIGELLLESVAGSRDRVALLGEQEILLDGTALTLNDLKAVVVLHKAGKTVRLGDLGNIEDYYAPQTVKFHFDGHSAVGVPVYAVRGTHRELAEKISKTLPDLKKHVPEKIQLAWVPFGVESDKDHAGDGLLTLYLRAPSSSSLSETEKRVAAVERFLEKHIPAQERLAILSEVGAASTWEAAYSANAGPMDATLFVPLSRERTLSAASYASKLRRLPRAEPAFADLGIRFASRDMPAPVDIRIQVGKLDDMMRLAQQVRRKLATIEGIVDADIKQRLDAPYLTIVADAEKAAAVGLSSREVLMQSRAAFKPQAARDHDYWIENKGGVLSLTTPFSAEVNLENALQTDAQGTNFKQPIKLSSLALFRRGIAAVEINHESLQRVLDVRANIEERPRRQVLADIGKMIQALSVPEGLKVELVKEP